MHLRSSVINFCLADEALKLEAPQRVTHHIEEGALNERPNEFACVITDFSLYMRADACISLVPDRIVASTGRAFFADPHRKSAHRLGK